MRLLGLLLICAVSLVLAQDTAKTCVASFNKPPYDAVQCQGMPLTPFCSEDSSGQTRCHPCTPYRKDGFCDCPAGQYCRPFTGSVNPNTPPAGICVQFDRSFQTCTTPQDCDGWVVGANNEQVYYDRFSCVNGFCRQCNSTYFANATINCLLWNTTTQTGSSRPGETRSCTADGVLVGGGAITATNPPTSAPPPSTTGAAGSTGTTTSGGARSTVAVLALLLCCVMLASL